MVTVSLAQSFDLLLVNVLVQRLRVLTYVFRGAMDENIEIVFLRCNGEPARQRLRLFRVLCNMHLPSTWVEEVTDPSASVPVMMWRGGSCGGARGSSSGSTRSSSTRGEADPGRLFGFAVRWSRSHVDEDLLRTMTIRKRKIWPS